MATERLGFIGLGVMGTPMAGHLAKAGYRVAAFDRDPARVASLAASSANVAAAASPKEVAAASDIVITMLPSGKEVSDVALGGYGIVHGLKPGGLLLDSSSSDPRDTRATAAKLAERGIAMVDAPVSGAEAGAKSARLVFMVGGEAPDVARVRPLLHILGKTHFHLGPVGSGHVMKAINNLVTAVTLMATAEGLLAGVKHGLDPATMNDVLDASTGQSWVGQTQFRQRIFNRRFDDAFTLALMMKDIDIARGVMADGKLDAPLSAKARELWSAIAAAQSEGASLSEVVRAMEAKAGVELRAGS